MFLTIPSRSELPRPYFDILDIFKVMLKEMKVMGMMVMMKRAKSKVVSEFGRKCDLEAIQAKGHDSYSQGPEKH